MQAQQTDEARIDALAEAKAQAAFDEMAERLAHRMSPPKIGAEVPQWDVGELHSTGDGMTLFDCRSGRTGCCVGDDPTIRYAN